MADKDIDLRLKTTADTSGAEETTQALKDTRSEAQKLQALRDVETVQRKQAEEAAKKEAEVLREIADAQQRIVAANLANAIGKVAKEFKGLNEDLDQVLSGTTNFLNVYASSGDVFKALGAVAAQSIRIVYDAYREGQRITDEGFKNQLEAEKNLTKAMEDRAQTVKSEKLEAVFEAETGKLREQLALVERLNELLAAGRKTEARVQDAISPAATPDQEVSRERDRGLADVSATIAEAEALANKAAEIVSKAIYNAQQVTAASGEGSDAALEAIKQRDAAIRESESATANLEQLRAERPLREAEINAAAVEALRSVTEKSKQALQEQARVTLADLQAVADANDGGGPAIKAVIQRITTLMQGGLSENEVEPLIEAMKLAQSSSTAIRTGLAQRLAWDIALAQQIEDANKQRAADQASFNKEVATALDTHKREIESLRAQVRAANAGY